MEYNNREKSKKGKIIKKVIIVFLIIFLMGVSFQAGLYSAGKSEAMQKLINEEAYYLGNIVGKYSGAMPGRISSDVDFNLFWDVWDILQKEYVDKEKINEKKMFYGAIKGLVSSLDDPYTVFMEPKIAKEFSDDLAGTFEGIGAEIGIKNDILTIIAPLPDMPAEKAGLKAGDKVYAIDGDTTAGISIDEAVSNIRGPKGTNVVLSIFRKEFDEVKDIEITRGKIIVKSIRTSIDEENNIFNIKITNFNSDTEDLFNKAVKEAVKLNPKGIILDLRNNPGGYLETAIEVSSEWVNKKIVVTEKYSEEKKFEHLSRGRARLESFPTVVLVNEGSASASEIVSGALQDYDKAIIIGKKTFGKGSVQTLTNLDDGSSVKITVAKWLTPNGRSINDEGIEPDIEIEFTIENFNAGDDPQMEKAIEILTGEISKEEIKNDEENTSTSSNDNEALNDN